MARPEVKRVWPRVTKPWRTVLWVSATLLLAGASLQAHALALGAATVRSTLGEPLRAEIEVPQISADEASAFQASVASPQAFRSAGVEYSSALAGVRVTLQRRANGQAYLRLVGERPVNEPFLGVVIEANWGSGRVVRDYTMLFDPPGRPATQEVAVTQPQVTPFAPPAQVPTPASDGTTQQPMVSAPRVEQRLPAADRPRVTPRRAAVQGPATRGQDGQITVQRGDTGYGLVSAYASEGVSLDQMLIAMMRANPHAFVGGNVNRLRAGVVINMPTADQAASVSHQTARRMVVAQSRDFQAYRRGLSRGAQNRVAASADRSYRGRVQTRVQDSRAPAPFSDRLTVSRGSAAASAAETRLAQSRQAQEQKARATELSRNINELSQLQSTPGGAPSSAATKRPDSIPMVPVPTPVATPKPAAAPASVAPPAPVAVVSPVTSQPAQATTSSTAANASASAPFPGSTVAAASDPQAAASVAAGAANATASNPASSPPAVAPMQVNEPSLLDSLTENPMLPVAGLGLVALLAGYGFYKARQRKKNTGPDSSFTASRLQPDSFFGASGGQRVNTKNTDSPSGTSSMAYSPSQLDAAGDVDPVAEADVYLAYGRDMQAEEILKEALRTQPNRIAVHRKLAEIYLKRRDLRALQAIAEQAYPITERWGPDWEYIRGLGVELDPANPLYHPGGQPAPMVTSQTPTRHAFGADTEPQADHGLGNRDLDSFVVKPTRRQHITAVNATPTAAHNVLGDSIPGLVATAGAAASFREASPETPNFGDTGKMIDFELDLSPPIPTDPGPIKAPAQPRTHGLAGAAKPLELDAIEFNLDAPAPPAGTTVMSGAHPTQSQSTALDPLETKIALALEFRAIGDIEGARALTREVVAESQGALKARADRLLIDLG